MRQCHRWRAEFSRIGDGKINLALGWDTAFEGNAICLGDRIAVTMFDEVQPLFLLQRSLEVGGFANQARLSLLTNAAAKQWLDEDKLVAVDQPLDLVLRRVRPQHLASGKLDIVEQSRAIQHSGNLHHYLSHLCVRRVKRPTRPTGRGWPALLPLSDTRYLVVRLDYVFELTHLACAACPESVCSDERRYLLPKPM